MQHTRRHIRAGNEHTIVDYVTGRLGLHTKNGPPIGVTPQNQIDYQDRKAETTVRHLIAWNFSKGDFWVTLTYPGWTRRTAKEAKNDIDRFLDGCRRRYKKAAIIFKYIMTAGRGERGAIHFHLVMTKFDTETISEIWWRIAGNETTPYPRVNFRTLDPSGYYPKPAAYLIKNSKEAFHSDDPIHKRRYCTSTNLRREEARRYKVKPSTWRRPIRPPKGYYIDKEKSCQLIDKNGYPWRCCVMVKFTTATRQPEGGEA